MHQQRLLQSQLQHPLEDQLEVAPEVQVGDGAEADAAVLLRVGDLRLFFALDQPQRGGDRHNDR